jgi:hypothetical protein
LALSKERPLQYFGTQNGIRDFPSRKKEKKNALDDCSKDPAWLAKGTMTTKQNWQAQN